jgi:hypothetical protein
VGAAAMVASFGVVAGPRRTYLDPGGDLKAHSRRSTRHLVDVRRGDAGVECRHANATHNEWGCG